MVEVKCNGMSYLFPEDSGIQDLLDMKAGSIREDKPNRDALSKPWSGLVEAHGGKVYTREVAVICCDIFEDLLDAKNIRVPCDDPDEEAERDPDQGGLYGTEYDTLLGRIEDRICAALEAFHKCGDYADGVFPVPDASGKGAAG